MIRKSSILITGASGEVGSQLIKILSNNENINIVTLDLHPLESNVSDMVSDKITGNVLDKNLIDQINLEFEIKEIYHLAAILSTRSEISPSIAHDVNINGTINFFELALKQSRSQDKNIKFFFPSSIAVYGIREKNNHAYKEHESLNPITIYGANKLYAENQIMSLQTKDRKSFMLESGIKKTGLDALIKIGYDILGLDTFFTFNSKEGLANFKLLKMEKKYIKKKFKRVNRFINRKVENLINRLPNRLQKKAERIKRKYL